MRVLTVVPMLAAALAGCVLPEPLTAGDDGCPGHWHAAVTFFVHDLRVAFTDNPDYVLEGGTMPLRTHMHQGGESLWHFEPPETECIPLREALASVDVTLQPDRLVLAGDYHRQAEWGGTHEPRGDQSLRAWMRPFEGEWEPAEVAGLVAGQVPDGAQVLVAFGAHDEADVARMQGEATQVPANLRPSGH